MGDENPQLELFDPTGATKQKQLDRAVDRINAKFGKRSVRRRG
jgi:hypothetical protein